MAKNLVLPGIKRIGAEFANGVMRQATIFPNIIANVQGNKISNLEPEHFLDVLNVLSYNGVNDGEAFN